MNPEVFYIHTHGEQRGPYTLPQIDHLLNSGLINEDTLFWREGLEQWAPVTSLVVREKKKPVSWVKRAIAIGVILVLAIFVRFFGPITMEGWREMNQHDYTAQAAYWRARGVVRTDAVPRGGLIAFREMEAATVQLHGATDATVVVRGELTDRDGQARHTAWTVPLKFDPAKREWNGGTPSEVTTP